MADSTVRIGLVLPDVMGTYGDGGNAAVLRQRLRLRGIAAEIVEITLADAVPDSLDLYTLGGAEDYAQRLATKHLIRHPGLQRAAGRGALQSRVTDEMLGGQPLRVVFGPAQRVQVEAVGHRVGQRDLDDLGGDAPQP